MESFVCEWFNLDRYKPWSCRRLQLADLWRHLQQGASLSAISDSIWNRVLNEKALHILWRAGWTWTQSRCLASCDQWLTARALPVISLEISRDRDCVAMGNVYGHDVVGSVTVWAVIF